MGSKTIRKRLKQDEFEVLEKYRAIKEKSIEFGVDPKNVRSGWLKFDKYASLNFKNPLFEDPDKAEIKDIDFDSIFKNKIKPIKLKSVKKDNLTGIFDRAVYTDVHINMNPNPDGHSLYGGRWNKEDIHKRLEDFVQHIVDNQKSNVLYLDDLGDFMDGLSGLTTRGGHVLPQIMTDQEAYDVGVSFKIKMIDFLVNHYETIHCRNVCNDNHAGAFGYFVNSAFKSYIELKYPDNVKITNQRKFIDHYIIKTKGKYNYGFIILHGKDDKNRKYGMSPKLTDKDQRVLENYINENFLVQKNLILEVSKGDSHQRIFDDASSSLFYYYNYGAFSPSSNYIQTNFQKGKSGFDTFNYTKNKRRPTNIPSEFEWSL